ncbi:Xylanase inhibitor, C-terminal [Dillenia turbinata]|uniref:Xylanase inhibitor, C-terminal n=1 Tax=Dillenia turbinata TaxID=194707 RepID=A0AAN8ZGB6_9MAGN
MQCGFDAKYGSGTSTSSGYLLTDEMMFTAALENRSTITSSMPITFGCSVNVSKKRIVDGILGLGPGDFSVISQLASTGEMPWVFSECLRSEADGGGFLIFGEVKDRTLVYTSLLPSKHHYIIALTSIALNGKKLPINPAIFDDGKWRVIIDSGTTLAYLVDDAYYAFSRAVSSLFIIFLFIYVL